jgi:arsenical pump membrane protein
MPLPDVIVLACLLTLLVVAVRHPSGWVEATFAVGATAVTLATGVLHASDVRRVVEDLGPVLVFLVAILVVADVCARAGLFRWAAGLVLLRSGASRSRLFTGLFLLAAVVTVVFSLDATVVLLTPIALAAVRLLDASPRPHAHACLRMANSASLLLPVSNLTNLLAFNHLDLTFLGFARIMAPVLAVVLVVEYVVLRLLFRRELTEQVGVADAAPTGAPEDWSAAPRVPLAVVAAMLVGFAATSPAGVSPAWPAGIAALLLATWGLHRGLLRLPEVASAAHLSFTLLVLALGFVVAALGDRFLADALAPLVPGSTGVWQLLAIAVLSTAVAAAVTNLSATLLLVPLLAPLGAPAVLAGLLGLNIGAGLTWTGSLANLLWRRSLGAHGLTVGSAEFHRVSLVVTPLSLLAGVLVLAATT